MGWCFALVNNKLAEIYFDETQHNQIKIRGHCYVDQKEYKTKKEQKWIEQDTKKFRVVYRNKKYKVKK